MRVYLDHAATTPLSGEVFEAMKPYFTEVYGNPDSLHSFGRDAAYAVSQARDTVAATLGVKPQEVYFTSGGTEADNWAIRTLAPEKEIAVSAIEHQAVLSAANLRGAATIPVTQSGIITANAVESVLTENTGLVAVMAVNNETGCTQPLERISALCRARGILLFSDCVQAANVLNLQTVVSYCDAVALSGHKIGGPKGTGVLVVKKGAKLSPLIVGGEQERGLRGGTLNVAGIVGFATALKKAQQDRAFYCVHTMSVRNLFEGKLLSVLGDKIKIDGTDRVPNISHITFQKGGEALLNRLDLMGVAASGGAACSAHASLPSHVMLAMGRKRQQAKSGIRFSFGKETTEAEVLYAADAVISCLKKEESGD